MRCGSRVILSHVNLSVNRGDFLAITGPNGGGKTTLLRIILKLLRPTSGEVLYHNGDKRVDSLHVGYLPQKNAIDGNFPITVTQVIASGLLRSKCDKTTMMARVDEMLHTVELTSHRDNTIGNLSGGQLQRALLGRALISAPEVLVLDEPLSYIDKRFEGHIYDIISDIAPTTTIILVSHEMSKIAAMANRHIIINRTLSECCATHHYFSAGCD